MPVLLTDIVASNKRIAATFPDGLVAVFVGGTSGAGEYTVKALAKYATKPRVYIVGRSQEAANIIIGECEEINPDGQFEFIQSDISLLKNVDEVCRQIKEKETAINVLVESQGTMAFTKKTDEGLPLGAALATHSRLRFILNLLPLIENAKSLRRIVSVLAATCEGAIDISNLNCEGFELMKQRDQTAAVQTLLLQEVARQAPSVSFIHTVPGVLNSGISRDADTLQLKVMLAITRVVGRFIYTPADECGEYHLFVSTSAMFPPSQPDGAVGVPLSVTIKEARAVDGKIGGGVYSMNNKGDNASPKVESVLEKYKEDGTAKKVWDHVMGESKDIIGKYNLGNK